MKVLLVNGAARSTAAILTADGIDSVHVSTLGLSAADDTIILDYALIHECIIVTLDADFHTLLALSGAPAPSIIRIRIEGLKGPALAEIVSRIVRAFANELTAGAVVSVNKQTARCHMLPLGPKP